MRERSALPYARGLDGLRGAAVLAVVAFHLEAPWAAGGFLGVSVFFTLSGYLITQLLVAEHDATGRVALGGFWTRRFRRLAPASLLCLVLVGLGAATGAFAGDGVPGDVVAGLADVANWRFAFAGSSYADLFAGGPSPLLHFWSLAVEEQFYLVFPLVVAGALRWRGRTGLRVVLAAGIVAGVAFGIAASADVAYYATPARLPELLAGALLALAFPLTAPRSPRHRRRIARLGLAGAAGLGVLVVTTATTSGWVRAGGLPLVAILSVAVVAASTGDGPVASALSRGWLVAIGRRSYGIYVYHWPLFVLLSPDRVGFDGVALVGLRLAATGAAAWLSDALLERPIREQRLVVGVGRAGVGSRRLLAGAAAAVLLLAGVATLRPPAPTPVGLAAPVGVVSFGEAVEARPLAVTVVGSAAAAVDWLRASAPDGTSLEVDDAVRAGCPLLVPDADAPGCPAYAVTATAAIQSSSPDLVVVAIGPAERAALAELDAAAGDASDEQRWVLATEVRTAAEAIAHALLDPLPAGPVLVVDTVPAGATDALSRVLPYVVVQRPDTDLRTVTDRASMAVAVADVVAHSGARRERLLVVGDSTSYEVAGALGEVATDRFDVLWAGGHNCPLVPVTELRWWDGAEWPRTECPSPAQTWPEVIERFQPDVVLVMYSLAELADQTYADREGWYVPGDPEWVAVHEAAMADLQALLARVGALTLVASTPPVATGTGFAGSPMASVDRLAAWTAQQHRWEEEWPSVLGVDWASMVAGADAAAGRNLRPDGVHFEQGVLPALVQQQLVPAIDAAEATAGATAVLPSGSDEVSG